jgi:argininosuccinate synthase
MWKLTNSLSKTPDIPTDITLHFTEGIPDLLTISPTPQTPNAVPLTHKEPVSIFLTLNSLARLHGIGRLDIVENRFIGVKSRGCYESPGGTILRVAHMDLEGLVLDKKIREMRDQFLTIEMGKILYNGFWWSPEREFVERCVRESQRGVEGEVRLRLEKGNVRILGRSSKTSVSEFDFHEQKEIPMMGNFNCRRTSMMLKSLLWTNLEDLV